MSIFNRFFGRKEEAADTGKLTANSEIKHPLSLTVLFASPPIIDGSELTRALCAYHASMREARVELEPGLEAPFGLAGWGKHVVTMVGFNASMPREALEACVAPSHYSAELKAQVRAHTGHIILYYAGFEEDPLEQYVALAAAAGALAEFSGVGVVNETARTSLPAGMFTRAELGDDSLNVLRCFPLTTIFCGFVKYEVEGVQGVWMRTYGAEALGCNNLATLAEGHHEGGKYSELFNDILGYQRSSGAELAAGHTMQVDDTAYIKLRAPLETEGFLHEPQGVLVLEMITQEEINR
ncbi:MAG: DUF4261 domain-containing protein [Proteobacteria bacterium]|nr:DUF4261 domain-containing protein [Pseudomonadota bacterium]